MMIVDADCHISSHKFDRLAMTAPELIAEMDRAKVNKAIIWLKPPYTKDIDPENRAIYEASKAYPGRFLPFGWANPRLGHAHTSATIQRCFEEYDFHGIKFNGAQDDYAIDDQSVLLHIEQAARYGKVIAFHIGSDAYENTHPWRLGRIAARFPETTFLLIHIGGAALPALDRAAIEIAAEHPNITLIGSAIHELAILQALHTLGPGRVCFGSDAPFRLMHVQLAKYRALLRDDDAQTQAKVLGGNILRVLRQS
jgi:uncharacterized protein